MRLSMGWQEIHFYFVPLTGYSRFRRDFAGNSASVLFSYDGEGPK
jgi:hypothetical protein